MQKQLFYLSILLLLFCASCNKSNNKQITPNVAIEHRRQSFRVTELIFKGHNYIYFRTGSGKYESGGVVHDPDCKCFSE